ncbi:uncharacterized protein LOC108216978 [Daucus carota subsp. sativus]|uniref:uncharacterized protein LOC108216978 n=1 Tax=Daucus carota subsp. sativus TaxID=79200 RepID=UPI0007EFB037|nr:PREDICTED: uncharacterized protein LOC108216978 [Daucus carota subsp. sativus]
MECISILSWNIRGIGKKPNRDNLKKIIQGSRPSIVCLQETKKESKEAAVRRSLGAWNVNCWLEIPPQGLSGGLIIFWDDDLIKLETSSGNKNWLALVGQVSSSGQKFICINVYGPQSSTEKRSLWSNLGDLISMHEDKAICLVGDFNCVRGAEDRKNCDYRSSDSKYFNKFIAENELFDVLMVGSNFTWCGPNTRQSKLDRALVNWEMYSKGDWKVKVLGRLNSDHRAILLYLFEDNWGAKPFKVFNCWLKDKELLLRIKDVWKSKGDGNYFQKIRHVRKWLSTWNKEENGNIDDRIKMMEVEQFQADEQGNESRNKFLNIELEKLYDQRAQIWQHKARINWNIDGDRNTKFFHNIMRYKWSKNRINGIQGLDGSWIDNPGQVKNELYRYFKEFFEEKHPNSIFSLGCLMERKLSNHESVKMIEEVTMGELELLCGIGSRTPKEFRPISLINASMKLVTKLLAIRLKRVMSNLISEVQSGFMHGRQISDGILLVSEIIGSLKRNRCQGVIIKLDFEKAFDSVNWNFLIHLLKKLNFQDKWVKWIEAILKTCRISVLVNGSPTKEFTPERGLRQGDPLSPLLFNLVGEVLHCMLVKAEEAGVFQGIRLGNEGGTVSHLQYADDTVIFVENNIEAIKGVKRVLQGFEILSGLKINYSKSKLYGFNNSKEEIQEWSAAIGCFPGEDSFQYLGLELAKSPKRVQFWDPLLDKTKKKLAGWKGRSVSLAGRVVLLQAALDSLPIYWFNMFLMPKTVVSKLEKIRRNFFWGCKESNGQEQSKMHLIAWEKICRPKAEGGVGIAKIRERNISMIGKWWWRCINERNKFWNVTLQSKYGSILGYDPWNIKLDGTSSYTLNSLHKIKQSGWDKNLLAN